MYFEDIYEKVKPLWRKRFSLDGLEKTETYITAIADNWNEVSHITQLNADGKYTEWERMLDFTMYQTLTDFAIKKWKSDKETILYFDEVPVYKFEQFYRKNLEAEGNEEFLRQYKGIKNRKLEF